MCLFGFYVLGFFVLLHPEVLVLWFNMKCPYRLMFGKPGPQMVLLFQEVAGSRCHLGTASRLQEE
jgi:hypothetical protein